MEPNTTLDVIHERSSIRSYTDQAVTSDQIDVLLRAGMAAPSAMNKQPWHFIAVTDKDILTDLGADIQTARMVKDAAAAIIVCGDLNKAGDGWLQQYWIQDCSAASQNILLAATYLGLGAVWTSVFPATERMETVAAILNLPDHIVPLNIIAVGYPAEEAKPMDKWNPGNVTFNKWK